MDNKYSDDNLLRKKWSVKKDKPKQEAGESEVRKELTMP